MRPSGVALHTAQQRAREKTFLADRGVPTAPFFAATTLDELWDAVARVGTPAVVKTAAFGYDGKGQHKVTTPADVEHIWTAIGHQEAVVEKFVSLQAEISVVAARGIDGTIVQYPAVREPPSQSHPRSDDGAGGHRLRRLRVRPPRSRARFSKSCSTSVCCASSSS